MAKNLKTRLRDLSGEEEIEWIIPHPFLPPRYRKLCQNRNMVLLIDRDFTAHIRWEGARRGEWRSPTPGEVRTLIRQVKKNMRKYRTELDVFLRFVTDVVDIPFNDPAENEPSSRRKPKQAERIDDSEEASSIESIVATIPIEKVAGMGGESPMPVAGEFFD